MMGPVRRSGGEGVRLGKHTLSGKGWDSTTLLRSQLHMRILKFGLSFEK